MVTALAVISAATIELAKFNFEYAIAAVEDTSAFTISPSFILAEVTASADSFASVTLAFVIFAVVTASVANIAVNTLPVPIAVTPALVMVTSPDGVTSVASLEALPTYILPSANVLIALIAIVLVEPELLNALICA